MRILSFIFALLFTLPAQATSLSYKNFATLPVQHEGRLKPLDSFARAFLIQFSGHDTVDNLPPAAWLAEMIFTPDDAYNRPVFDIPNPSVQAALSLPRNAAHHYSFLALSAAFAAHRETLTALLPRQGDPALDPAQQQLLALYTNTLWYFEISRSLSLVLPEFATNNAALAQAIGVTHGQPFSWLDLTPHRAAYLALVMPQLDKPSPDPDLLRIGMTLQHMEVDKQSRVLRVIPPQWQAGGDAWLSPWGVLQSGAGSPATAALLNQWRRLGDDYRRQDGDAWDMDSQTLRDTVLKTPAEAMEMARLTAEYFYNRTRPFTVSLGLYILSFLLLLAGAGTPGAAKACHRLSFAVLACGALLHAGGLAARIFIMARPPVGTLYESILFVGLIIVLAALALEWRSRFGIGLLLGAFAGSVLQFIGLRYASDGDTMGQLVAVLNTNFWLATHVVCVTIGYGACLVTGLLAHAWLFGALTGRTRNNPITERATLGAALVALLFATTGTILGGIWADQSWGRFWGWDPKENGALLIVLWLLWLLHGRLSGLLQPLAFMTGAALTTIVVALSWFGVNLLGVGLHSYGFTAGIAVNLFTFIAAELALIGGCHIILRRRAAA